MPVKLTVVVGVAAVPMSRAVAERTFLVAATPRWAEGTRALLEGIQALPERVQAALPAEPRTVITVLLLTLTMRYRRTTSTVGTPLTRALAALSLTRLDLRRAVRASPAVRDL
jgi:hypothetical protein